MRKISAVLLICAVGLPLVASAQAGFAKQSIFLSRSAVIEGESVLVHAVVSNGAAGVFEGDLALREGEQKIGTVPVKLESGKAIAVSVSWQPRAGTRTVTADLRDKTGVVVESTSERFVINERPKPAATSTEQVAAAIDSSDDIQDKIESVSPAARSALAPVFAAIDQGRNSAADALDSQLKIAGAKLGKVQGDYTEREDGELPNTESGFWLALWTLYFYLLTVLRFLIGNAAFFYPVLALLFFIILWRTFRRFRRR